MSRARLAAFALLCLPCLVWTFLTLRTERLRLQHHATIFALETRGTLPNAAQQQAALAAYNRAATHYPCHAGLHQDRLLLLAQAADDGLRADDLAAGDDVLQALHAGLRDAIACNPMDAKLWLNLASTLTFEEGFSLAARNAYQFSARVAPKEAWLAEKRLMFIAPFVALLDAPARSVARADSAVLDHAAGFRKARVMRAMNVGDAQALDALLATTKD